ncbi:MAG: amidohydrolase family protein [Chitinophagaceae bacterium]|nr:amidohydrolase family protein [Chitinophagaceae bacterium]
MVIIDAHQHFWNYDPVRHDWIGEDMKMIRRDFQPMDLKELYAKNGVSACVAVQADQSEAETEMLLAYAKAHDFIKGVVGWVDLRGEELDDRLSYYSSFPKLKGFRHVLQNEEPSFMLDPDFLRGIGLLQKFDLAYDLLIFPHHLDAAIEMVGHFPEQRFVVDHLAKPLIKKREIREWKEKMKVLSTHPHLYCKISGMVTEAEWDNWKSDDLLPYLEAVTEIFGPDRLMFGSDWPVCLVASSYDKWLGIVKKFSSSFSPVDQAKIFGGNVNSFYRLNCL